MDSRIISRVCLAVAVGGMLVAGCGTDYAWRSSVPKNMRTVSCPTFRNESDVMEAGAIAARQVLREFQREGTFVIKTNGDAALEVQGVVKSVSAATTAYDRRHGMRLGAYEMQASCAVSVIDKRRRAVLVDNRTYTGTATFTGGQDHTTALRDATARAMDDLSRQIVDDVLNLKFEKKEATHEE